MINKKICDYETICPEEAWEELKKELAEELIKQWSAECDKRNKGE